MRGRVGASLLTAVLLGAGTAGCATNPATGESQLMLVSERQEIQMGRQASGQVERQIGLYDAPELQSYVDRVGMGLARVSERPDLPWSFDVVDDEVVNAFALPGGFIYLTRGIMAQFNSEAEMAAVLGHEIGHVTARHSAEQMSTAQLTQVGLGLGTIFIEPLRGPLGDVVGAGLGLMFLKFSRDDERQADALGVRYMVRENYDPARAVAVHEMLLRQREAAGGGGLPGWLSTHPTPEDRIERIRRQLDTLSREERAGRVEREAYLGRIDGMVYGPDPRNGFFRDGLFLHPDLRFRLRFPDGWQTRNMARAVMAVSPGEDALLELTLASERSHGAAAQEFFGQQGVRSSRVSRESVNGHAATVGYFQAQTEQGVLEGLAAFIEYGGRTYRILGYTPRGRLNAYDGAFRDVVGSFDRLTDRAALNVQPMRLDIIEVSRAGSIADLVRSRGAPVPAEDLALLNNVDAEETLAAGTLVKWVTGSPPPGSSGG